jgi:hypothetical protein
VGISYKRLRQGIGVLACVVVFGGAAGNAAAQGPPSPQPSRSPVHPTIRPDPAPGAPSSTTASTTRSVPPSSPSVSTPSPASTLPVYAPPRALKPVHTVKSHTRIHRAKTRSAPRVDTRPIRSLASWAWRGELLATSAATPSSGTNFLLLFVGLALVLLTIGETTFLRRAARAPKPRRRTDEQLAVHRVQLRR